MLLLKKNINTCSNPYQSTYQLVKTRAITHDYTLSNTTKEAISPPVQEAGELFGENQK